MTVTILQGDALEKLKTLEDESVHCCVTSPPYWGLRDYGVDGQIGLESTPEEYVAKMVEVFREVRRVLREDGTLWLNLGDTYNANYGLGFDTNKDGGARKKVASLGPSFPREQQPRNGLPTKNLFGIPWRVALALQTDGWYLRQDIIWHKPNAKPESAKDRCTTAHEYLFLLSRAARYYYDQDAIREPNQPSTIERAKYAWCKARTKASMYQEINGLNREGEYPPINQKGRNRRSVWTIPTQPYSEAHYATFPHRLVEPCIMAGCPPGGIVLDPFAGSGTTGQVAQDLGRNAILIELNPEDMRRIKQRIAQPSMALDFGE